ncbi:hypothetical protein CMV_025803 [Castanea mollissima]|uniref:F-box associated beta-propeller type 3 domain-containing protein n=1 Tax=Castanea mollissima TaxID=60419 RepID=A0A8J4Q8T4_9ROSI|nr:hypothetical protein CMV_025803 [Castanea mollissima]
MNKLFIAGSCNDLVCLEDVAPSGDHAIFLILWNPSIRKAISLPSPVVNVPLFFKAVDHLGFGYDPITDDYKIVRLVYLQGGFSHNDHERNPPIVQIYTLRTGAWRTIPGHDSRFTIVEQTEQFSSVFVNGSVHWFVEDDDAVDFMVCNMIISFDIKDEVFHEMAAPKSFERRWDLNMKVAVVGGLLALVPCNYDPDFSDPCYSVWENSPSTSKGRGEHEEKGKMRLGPVLSKQEKVNPKASNLWELGCSNALQISSNTPAPNREEERALDEEFANESVPIHLDNDGCYTPNMDSVPQTVNERFHARRGKASGSFEHFAESVGGGDPYSLSKAIEVPNQYEYLDDYSYVKVTKALQQKEDRLVFMGMPEHRRKAWMEKIAHPKD